MSLAVVTGAGVRVGRAIALALAADGHDVVVHTHRSAPDDTVRAIEALGRKAYVERADLADLDEVAGFAARVSKDHGAVDVLVNSAAGYEKIAFADVTREKYALMQRVNCEAPFFLTQGLLPALERAGGAREGGAAVVNIIDIAAERPMSGYAHYMASKGALATLTKALAAELAPRKIRVNGVSPGSIMWPSWFTAEQKQAIARRIPMGDVGSAEDVAQAVVFLASTRAKFINGTIVPVDGGRAAVL